MKRLPQAILCVSTALVCWLGMQMVHEAGHVCGAVLTRAEVTRVVLHPLTISRTDLGVNPNPLFVVWAGPVGGVLFPLLLWATLVWAKISSAFVARFFAGFCLIANGAYIAFGSFDHVGDCGEMLRHGSPVWQLWLFGVVTIPPGVWLWYGQGPQFGLGPSARSVEPRIAYGTLLTAIGLIFLGLLVGGR